MPLRPPPLALLIAGVLAGCASRAPLHERAPRSAILATPRVTPPSLPPTLAFFVDPQTSWPLIHPGVESRYFSSFDRSGGNDDGFRGTYSCLYTSSEGACVIFDALGPGVLSTLWFTGPEEGGEGLDLGRIRFYFDDERAPRITTDVPRLFGGKDPPFLSPLVADNGISTGGFVSWVPLAYSRRLVITTERRPSFYITQYDTFPRDVACPSWQPGSPIIAAAQRTFSSAATPCRAVDLAEVQLHHRHQGAGTIERVQLEVEPADRGKLHSARVQLFWDGSRVPSVDLPLDMFFGSGLGAAEVRSLTFYMSEGIYENRLPMPFWSGFELRVSGVRGRLRLRLGPPRFTRDEAGHLHAAHRIESPTRAGDDFEWLSYSGAGRLVATVLAVRPPTPQTKRWWEGDLRSYVDGRRTPGMHGTGHEDDHLGGWSNTFFSGPFTLPMHGEPRSTLIEREGEQYNAEITAYRLWPGVHFSGSLRHSVEHGSENRVQASYEGAAFFYARRGAAELREADELDLGSELSLKRHAFIAAGELSQAPLRSSFEGRFSRATLERPVSSHRGAATFRLVLPTRNAGCWLRRLFDQAEARQRARLEVERRDLGDWYVAEGNRKLRWAERDFFLPASVTRGRSSLAITVTPAQSAPPWTASSYRLLCLEDRVSPAL